MNLLLDDHNGRIEKTALTRKLTLDGVTKIYPVYRVPADLLYYNDQNDRIATWISQYKSENGAESLDTEEKDKYNDIIEGFIVNSNPAAIDSTKMNISLVGQREPGVALADGRIIDGNRRFTCIRQLNREGGEPLSFETVILDTDIDNGRKKIKMLELAIQHGEEKKVDYNPIEIVIGAYQDIIETELLTIEEYAESTNQSVNDVKKRLEVGKLVVEFLEYIHMPKQYYIAREKQVYSVFTELLPLLRKCVSPAEQQKLKETVYSNIMMGAITDSRKYIRDLNSMMENGFFSVYMKEQEKIRTKIEEDIAENITDDEFKSKSELNEFVKKRDELVDDMKLSMDKSLLKAKKRETKSKPSKIVGKSINMLKDVDTRIFEKLNDDEKDQFKSQLSKISNIIERFDVLVDDEKSEKAESKESLTADPDKEADNKNDGAEKHAENFLKAGKVHVNEPVVMCKRPLKNITNLTVSLEFEAFKYYEDQESNAQYIMYFIDEKYNAISNICNIDIECGTVSKCMFTLNADTSQKKTVFLIMRSVEDAEDECQRMIEFHVNIAFGIDWDL